MSDLESRIRQWYEQIGDLTPANTDARRDVELVIAKLVDGQLRVAVIDAWSSHGKPTMKKTCASMPRRAVRRKPLPVPLKSVYRSASP